MAKKATAKSKSKGIVYKAFLRQGSVAPYVHDYRYTNDEWVWHGDDNLWPEKVRTLVDNCGPLERSATMLSEFIAGEGVYFVNEAGDEMPEAKKLFQEWMLDTTEEQFLAQTAYEIALGMGFTWMVRRSEGGDIVRIDHMDRFGFRAAKMKGGRIPAFWWSNSWTEVSRNSSDDRYKPEAYPAFDPSGEKKHAAEILFAKQYRQRETYYGRFFWLGAWNAAEVWTKVDDYNRNQIDTGFLKNFFQVQPIQGAAANPDTRVKVIYDNRNLYIGAFCPDSLGRKGVRVPDLRRDFEFFTNDIFGIAFDPFRDKRNAIVFQTNPHGAQRDILSFDDQFFDREWDALWKVRTNRTDSGWAAEIAIPWKTLRYPKDSTTWGINFLRIARNKNQFSGWNPYPRATNYYRMAYEGLLTGLKPPPPSANIRINPYFLYNSNRQQTDGENTVTDDEPKVVGEVK